MHVSADHGASFGKEAVVASKYNLTSKMRIKYLRPAATTTLLHGPIAPGKAWMSFAPLGPQHFPGAFFCNDPLKGVNWWFDGGGDR